MDEALRKSVTLGDHTDEAGRKGVVLNVVVGGDLFGQGGLQAGLPPAPPRYWTPSRDNLLRATAMYEPGWASALYIAITKMASLSWNMKGLGLRSRRMRDLLLQADGGRGWVPFLSRHLRDYLTSDNGAFIEVVRSTSASGSRILGLFHLDSSRCQRTGDPDIPILYTDREGKQHELKDYQVITMSDMPDPADYFFGVGLCAASRAYPTIYRLHCIERYVSEKVAGRRPLSLYFVNNISEEMLRGAVVQAEAEAQRKGYVSYMGAVLIPSIDPSSPPQVASIDLAGLPDGFQADTERRNAYLIYADAIGLDPQEIDPQLLASRALGTGAQARVIDDKASGKGLVAWRQDFTHHMNEDIAPESVTFSFTERDYRDRLQQAQLDSSIVGTVLQMVNTVIPPEAALQLLVDKDILPKEFLSQDMTPIEDVGDNDNSMEAEVIGSNPIKPEDLQPQQVDIATDQSAPPPISEDPAGPLTNKEALAYARLKTEWIPATKDEIERTPVVSSNLESVGYQGKPDKKLEVGFQNGSVYDYPDVDKRVYNNLMDADSKGKYFWRRIRRVGYPYHKIKEEPDA